MVDCLGHVGVVGDTMKPTFYNAVGIAELMMKDGYEIIRVERLHREQWTNVGRLLA